MEDAHQIDLLDRMEAEILRGGTHKHYFRMIYLIHGIAVSLAKYPQNPNASTNSEVFYRWFAVYEYALCGVHVHYSLGPRILSEWNKHLQNYVPLIKTRCSKEEKSEIFIN